MAHQEPTSEPPPQQESGDASPTPADGGTLMPPPSEAKPAVAAPALNLASADSSLAPDTSHVQHLINHGADVNAPDNNGWTPLHTAAYHGQEEIVRILLNANANVNARNKQEETPLHLAAKWPQDRVVEALLSGGADLAARNKRGRTPAHVAALFNRHAILDRLLNAELVKTLLRHNAGLGLLDVRGHAPLHFLPPAQVGDWLHWAAYEGREELLGVLLSRPGVRPDCYNEEGLTPLHLAAHANSTAMVSMLLNAGAKVNAPSQPAAKPSGKDAALGLPLPGAPGSITAGISVAGTLRAYGSPVYGGGRDPYAGYGGAAAAAAMSGSSKLPPGELTALHIAAERGSAELVRLLVGAGARVNAQGERGMPPLHVAVWEGNTPAVVSLLAAKASVSLKSKSGGFTAVHCACLSSRATPELLGLLLENGGAAVLEERCQEGWTALHLACQAAPPAMVELLLQRGARPNAKGKAGRTAADCAAKRPEILQLLHVATGGKVPLPLGLAAGVAGGRGPAAAAASSGGGAGGAGGAAAASGLLPGTAAVLEPLESVEATLAALLADMGGALCSMQAGALFGGGCACCVDPVGHCIRPLDKRLVLGCTLGCAFSFHLPCWKSAREVLKERWAEAGFGGGALAAAGRYPCIAPGCPGYVLLPPPGAPVTAAAPQPVAALAPILVGSVAESQPEPSSPGTAAAAVVPGAGGSAGCPGNGAGPATSPGAKAKAAAGQAPLQDKAAEGVAATAAAAAAAKPPPVRAAANGGPKANGDTKPAAANARDAAASKSAAYPAAANGHAAHRHVADTPSASAAAKTEAAEADALNGAVAAGSLPGTSGILIICGAGPAGAPAAEAASCGAVAAADGLPSSVVVPRSLSRGLGGAPQQLLSPHAVLALAAGSLEPGGYARAVCPGLRPGVHRVTHSAGSPGPASPSGSAATSPTRPAPGKAAAKAAEAVAVAMAVVQGGDSGGSQAADGATAVVVVEAGGGGARGAEPPAGPVSDAGASAPAPDGAAAATQALIAAPATPPATAQLGAGGSGGGAAAGPGCADGDDILLAALHGLRKPPPAAAAAPAAASGNGNGAAAGASIGSRHLLIESVDIPLLASTPGMLEAWLTAHVACHGRLAAYRILAPQGAVAVSLEADGAAAAAAEALARRPTLLVAPLAVAPLEAFPEDEALANSAAQVARAAAAPGDRTWCGRVAELWQRLADVPPPVHTD
ncbi:hypothetical protein GPECTOR_326g47 [Gonium pectorale]|uniref:Uncharacterized protein n=1 Tax=Gonium pectorale TaxID=33097 RepID=A0A150FVN0_GONPE|nr:hypothetical protein GPECTOR_326g47 [Gonium pectorale]|eukprot:KXZ41673.1 hypothetical protein GPECTOR_326g47 [Gonium pectorale]